MNRFYLKNLYDYIMYEVIEFQTAYENLNLDKYWEVHDFNDNNKLVETFIDKDMLDYFIQMKMLKEYK